MHRDGKGANPWEHSSRCDQSECSQQRGNLKDNGYNSYRISNGSTKRNHAGIMAA
ncbi:hypothetical protein [Photorhabdus bodei]|uniref:hypothetical protein n=1 Tax=Photorhabdus bodei TaxID=2029681 RepID=UPI001E37CF44|nr:hypothetical protein [Photorhabdus bodei]MCC8465348.1 hypothetical protein [Photorhabdus bodei]